MRTMVFFMLAASASPKLFAAEPALMPLPVKVQATAGKLAINANFVVETVGAANARLAPAVRSFLARVSRQTGVMYAPVPPAPADARRLVIDCAGGPEYPALGEDESYTLDVSDAEARIKAATAEGAIHGLATLAQLIQPGPDGFQVAGVHIEDRPRFPWRGLMLDVCRHWMPVEVVKRNLDAMAAVKLNVLHWHLSEDQGFRVESKRYPRLHELGSNGDYYTQDQIREIVAYARDRGIRVIPEFDVPGHSTAWFLGYPELASAPGPFTLGGRASSVMDPSKESTYTFLDGFIGEMAQLFADPFYHIGGDEVSARAWNQSDSIQAFAKEHGLKDAPAIQVYFNQRLLKIVQKYGKTMVGWDEILVPGLPTDAVIQSWRGQKSLSEAASKGYRGILSWGYYLDHLSPASQHYAVDPLGGPDAAALTPEQASRIMGGEACMWAELVGPETVDSRLWPRTAAIAERLWSSQNITDIDSMYARLEAVSRNLEFTGVMHRSYYLSNLDRIAGSQPVGPLRVLADVVEVSDRLRERHPSTGLWMPVCRKVNWRGPWRWRLEDLWPTRRVIKPTRRCYAGNSKLGRPTTPFSSRWRRITSYWRRSHRYRRTLPCWEKPGANYWTTWRRFRWRHPTGSRRSLAPRPERRNWRPSRRPARRKRNGSPRKTPN